MHAKESTVNLSTHNRNPVRRFRFGVSDFSTSEPLFNAEKIIACGMDFIEPGLAKIAAMSDSEFDNAAARMSDQEIHVQSANWFLPPELKITGPDISQREIQRFLELALGRAAKLGARAIVFGSPGSRTIPSGFSANRARQQLIEFCNLCSAIIRERQFGLKIAVEHVNHTETNFVNTFAQAFSVVQEIDRPEIALAADFYHFAMENEPMEIMNEAGQLICAVQLADPNGRCFPKPNATIPGLEQFMQILVDIGYDGGISVEATVGDDLLADCRDAATKLKSLMSD